MKAQKVFVVAVFLIVTLACQAQTIGRRATETMAVPLTDRTYENDAFRFTIPAGWQTHEEVWGRPMQEDQDYYGLGLNAVITIQYPPGQGQGNAFFAVATAPLTAEEDLEAQYERAYIQAVPAVEDESRQLYEHKDISGFEITYKRPWGEPWWRFRDIWLQRGGVVYVLSFHASPASYETYQDTLDQIVDSFSFKN